MITVFPSKINSPRVLAAVIVLSALLAGPGAAQVTPVGGIARNFTLTNRANGQPLNLTDFAGKVLVIDFFAYWCGPCQASSPDVETNIQKYYAARGGNAFGVPVQVLAVSIDASSQSQINAFVAKAGLELVADDNGGTSGAWKQFNAGNGIPLFVIVNCVAGSPSHAQWKVLYKQSGYSGAPTLRGYIDAVQGSVTDSEIAVEQPAGTNLSDGSASISFGSVDVGSASSIFTFTIKNTGSGDLTGLAITKDGAHPADFAVLTNPVAPVSGPSGSTTFTVNFTPGAGGTRTAAIHIANNDADENPFDIVLTGTGHETAPPPEFAISGGSMNFTVRQAVAGCRYQLQRSVTMAPGTWQDSGPEWVGNGSDYLIQAPYDPALPQCFYRLVRVNDSPAAASFVQIPAGSFTMGNALSASGDGDADELPLHTVSVSAFLMQTTEVSKAEWDEARTWGLLHGYPDLAVGGGKAADHPVQTVSWYDAVKWCNAKSEKEGLTPCYYTDAAQTLVFKTGSNNIGNTMVKWTANGYRLPTEAEWEKAARGGLSGKRFPWGDPISHSVANFRNAGGEIYQSGTTGYHPAFSTGGLPYTSQAEVFAANGYGLYDMAGGVREWCWDWYSIYSATSQTDPRGAASGAQRVYRGGSWGDIARFCRIADRPDSFVSSYPNFTYGFRPVRSAVP